MNKGTATTTHFEKKLDISELQKLVGGYVEVINLPNNKTNLICNEDGKMYGLAKNSVATKMLHENYPHTKGIDWVVGDVVILHGSARIRK
jgi:hypothetical protein